MLQMTCLEFLVSGSLDGFTPAPPLHRASGITPRPTPGTDPENIQQFAVDNLGIIDLDFPTAVDHAGRTVARGNRYVMWFNLDSGGPAGQAKAAINVVAFRPDQAAPVVQEVAYPLVDERVVYLRRCIFVPHGSALQLQGFNADDGVPIIVRMGIAVPRTSREEVFLADACCCLKEQAPLTPVCLNPPDPASVDPDRITTGHPGVIDVFGSDFQDGDQVTIGAQGEEVTTFIDPTHLQVSFTASGLGRKDVTVSRPSIPGCSNTINNELNIVGE